MNPMMNIIKNKIMNDPQIKKQSYGTECYADDSERKYAGTKIYGRKYVQRTWDYGRTGKRRSYEII